MSNLELLKKLIKIESVSPNDNGCFDVIKQQFDGLDFSFEETNYKNISNLIITNGDSKNKTFCFLGHTDVVPPGPESEWSVPPFSGEIIDNKIYGRGAADMKGGVACFISALKEFLSENKDPSFNIMVLLNSNEEGKLENGKVDRVINEMIDKDKFIDFCLIGEPSSSKKVGDVIRIGRRGSLSGNLKVYGIQGHVAYPKQALNPILGIGKTLEELKNMEWDRGNENFEPTSFQVSNIKSGTGAENVVPGVLEMTFNFRFSPESSPDGLKEKFEALLKKSDLKYDVSWTLSALPFLTAKTEFIEIVKSSIKEINNIDTKIDNGGGTSDGRWVAPMGSEIVELGPLNKTIHQIDEHVDIEDLSTLKEIYKKILIKVHQSV
ncbi:MAG: succinyl-diaminopimelate desuccinylase [Gammaproteobacteria bacterium]|nr:succinyl-diaminopimelate desuccinylase [Gammaproteobacteria bacterium]